MSQKCFTSKMTNSKQLRLGQKKGKLLCQMSNLLLRLQRIRKHFTSPPVDLEQRQGLLFWFLDNLMELTPPT